MSEGEDIMQPEEPGELSVSPGNQPFPSPIRVGWIAQDHTFAQIGRILGPLAVGLMDEFIAATVFVPEGVNLAELSPLPVEVVTYSRLNWMMFKARRLAAMAEEVQSRQITLLHALDAPAAELTRQLAEAGDLPYVVSAYGFEDARLLGGLGESCRAVLAAGDTIRQRLLTARIAPREQVLLARPGVYHVHHATYFSDDRKSIVIVAGGPLDDVAAYEAVLKAFEAIRQRHYDCAFFIIGSGKAEGRIRLAAEKMGLRSALTLVDRQSGTQLQGILKAADIYISPVNTPQVDLVALLAMAAGDPVLAANSHLDDFFIEGQTALLFGGGDAGQLTRKLLDILDNPKFGTGLADSALAYLEQHHSAAAMVAAVTRTYREAAFAPRPARSGSP